MYDIGEEHRGGAWGGGAWRNYEEYTKDVIINHLWEQLDDSKGHHFVPPIPTNFAISSCPMESVLSLEDCKTTPKLRPNV